MAVDFDGGVGPCPVCEDFYFLSIIKELDGHDKKKKQCYRLLSCHGCGTYFKEVWKYVGLVRLKEAK